MEAVSAIRSAIILAYIQSASTIQMNLHNKNLTTLNHPVTVPKCCNEDSVMTDKGCRKSPQHKFLPLVNVLIHNSTHVNDEPVTNAKFNSFTQNINCIMGSYALRPEDDNFYLLENGSLVITNQHKLLSPNNFCFESVDIVEDGNWTTTAFVCVPVPANNNSNVFLIIYVTCLFISCVSLALMCVIYGYYRSHLPQSKFIVFYCLSLLGCYIIVAAAQVFHLVDGNMCDLLGTLFYIFLIATIGCLSLIPTETYKRVRRYVQGSEGYFSHITLLISLFSCTVMVVTIVLVVLQVTSVPRTFLKPQLGRNSCWYTGEKSETLYFIVPILVQIFINITMLSLSQTSIKRLDSSYSKQPEWELLKEIHLACIGLLVLTVILWSWEFAMLWLESVKLSLAFDALESLQGFLVSIVFYRVQRLKYNLCNVSANYDNSRNTSDTSID